MKRVVILATCTFAIEKHVKSSPLMPFYLSLATQHSASSQQPHPFAPTDASEKRIAKIATAQH
jgi:hypothetical protein